MLEKKLSEFFKKHSMNSKGALCVALVVTRNAKSITFPINPDEMLTDGGGQVLGLGKSAVQNILSEYGITKVLAEEGGRTSRGSVGNMRSYVQLLNNIYYEGNLNLSAIEKWWVDRISEYFKSKPFVLHYDPSWSLTMVIKDLLVQAQKRQEKSAGTTYFGTVLQHLVGAKLDVLLSGKVQHHGASVADQSSGRDADFIIEDVMIHVTTAPTESLIRKCERNLLNNLKPIIITTHKGLVLAEGLSEQKKLDHRIDVFEAEQFLAGNLYEIGKFASLGRTETAKKIIDRYNQIIEEHESNDPSLKIITEL